MRLTVAQALVRFLSVQYSERDGVAAAADRGLLRHLRPRQRRRRRPGAARGAGRAALLPRPQRAGDGAHRGRLRAPEEPAADARVHVEHRPGRDQHGHRRGAGDDQPAARAAAPGRRVRHPRARHRAAAARGRPHRSPTRSTTRCARCRSSGTRIERPEQLVPALLGAMRVLTDPAETGAVTLALPQDVQAEAYEFPDELFEQARLARAPPAAGAGRAGRGRRAAARRAPAADRQRRRHHLRRGDRRAARVRRGDRDRRRRDAGRQGLAPLRPSAGARRDRRHRHHRGQRRRARGRRDPRRRHALERLHDRLALALLRRRRVHQPQRGERRRVQARGPAARRRCAARAGSAQRGARRDASRRRRTTGTRSSSARTASATTRPRRPR